jgi:TonB-dependent SusC/RagA subfamily outer membrane receptor
MGYGLRCRSHRSGTECIMSGIREYREVRMKTVVKGVALAFGFALFQGCAGKATMPTAQPTPQDEVQGRGGYGEQPEEQVAGAVARLESEEESGGSFATMVDMIRGRVAGLEIAEDISGDITVRIRGDLSNVPPLLVVDGVSVPAYSFSSTLRSMNPQDVLRIQVLKDTGSTASYGMRGAHGVILIRLKRR